MLHHASLCVILTSLCLHEALAGSSNVTLGNSYVGDNAVRSNFFGISIELSVIDTLSTFSIRSADRLLTSNTVGEDTSSIPSQMVNYLSILHNKVRAPGSLFRNLLMRLLFSSHSMPRAYGSEGTPWTTPFTNLPSHRCLSISPTQPVPTIYLCRTVPFCTTFLRPSRTRSEARSIL